MGLLLYFFPDFLRANSFGALVKEMSAGICFDMLQTEWLTNNKLLQQNKSEGNLTRNDWAFQSKKWYG